MIDYSAYATMSLALLPLAAGASILWLRTGMLCSATGRFFVGAALGLDALTVYSLLHITRMSA